MNPHEAGVIILAAGRSERMKVTKALLQYDDNFRFIEQIVSTYSGWGCNEIVVVTNPQAAQQLQQLGTVPSTVKVIINDHLEFERFYSVKLGLGAIRTSEFCFIQNVDNPFIDGTILDFIFQNRSDEKYVSPVFKDKGGHPVLLNRQNIDCICNWPVDSDNFKEVMNTMECRKVDIQDDRVLININSPEDYKRFCNV